VTGNLRRIRYLVIPNSFSVKNNNLPLCYLSTWDGVVGTEVRLRDGLSWVRILVGVRYFSHFYDVQTGTGVHPASYLIGTAIFSRGIKRPGLMLTGHVPLVLWFCSPYLPSFLPLSSEPQLGSLQMIEWQND
jgi:hypothetical protein